MIRANGPHRVRKKNGKTHFDDLFGQVAKKAPRARNFLPWMRTLIGAMRLKELEEDHTQTQPCELPVHAGCHAGGAKGFITG